MSLTSYSPNIICTEPDVNSLMQGLREGALLAQDTERRKAHYAQNAILRDWRESFRDALERYS